MIILYTASSDWSKKSRDWATETSCFPGEQKSYPTSEPLGLSFERYEKADNMIKFEIFNIFFYIRKTIQLSMTRIYEEKRDISKHRKLKNKTNTTFFWYNNKKKGKPRKTKVPSGDAHGKYDFFLGE